MNIENLAKGLTYKGEAEGKRQSYSIFEGDGFYFIISFKKSDPHSGNFDVVDSEAVEYVRKHFAGKTGVTAQDVFARAHTTRHVSVKLDALSILYVLVGIGHAKVDKRHKEKSLYFNIK